MSEGGLAIVTGRSLGKSRGSREELQEAGEKEQSSVSSPCLGVSVFRLLSSGVKRRGVARVGVTIVCVSDELLRGLQSAWKKSGTAADEARYLVECLRQGVVSQLDVELAALCGHEAAMLCVKPATAMSRATSWLRELVLGRSVAARLSAIAGREVAVRIAIAAARMAVPVCNELFPGETRAARAVAAAEAWVLSPCEETERLAASAHDAATEAWSTHADSGSEQLAAIVACEAAAAAVEDLPRALDVEGAVVVALRFARGGSYDENKARVSAAIRDEIVPWLLKYGDPVRDRGPSVA